MLPEAAAMLAAEAEGTLLAAEGISAAAVARGTSARGRRYRIHPCRVRPCPIQRFPVQRFPVRRRNRAHAAIDRPDARLQLIPPAKGRCHSTGSTARNANPNLKSHAVRSTLNSASVAGALRNRGGLRNAGNRARITAAAATAGWHNGRDGGNGWWRHGNGGYGWVGPLYWPFAYYDLYGYAMWGNGYDNSFWGYGYGDIYAGIFAPYGYDDLTGYMPQYASNNPGDVGQTAPAPDAPAAATDQLTQMCGADSRDIAGLPIDQFQQAIQPTAEQSAALDDLANASLQSRAGHQGRLPERYRAHRAEPARGHAKAHRGDDRRGADGAAAAREILRPLERRAESETDRTRQRSAAEQHDEPIPPARSPRIAAPRKPASWNGRPPRSIRRSARPMRNARA